MGRCLAVFVTGLATAAQGQTIEPKPVESLINWVYRYEEGKKLAKESGKPMFVVFRCER
jgi:hypothetical protein